VNAEHPYSLVRRVSADRAYVSGVLPYRHDGTLADESVEAIDATLRVLSSRLADAGFEMRDVAKTTVFLTDLTWIDDLNRAWRAAFSDPSPARSSVQVSALPRGARIELEAIVDRTTPVTATRPEDEDSVRAWLAGWGEEVASADVATARFRFSEDLLAFGTYADVVRGRAAVEAEQWRKIWSAIEDFAFELDDLEVIVSEDRLQAVAITPWTSTGVDADGGRFARPGRATIVLSRPSVSEPWLGRHTHFSLARGVPQETFGRRPSRS
jgi:enamine deaminase RidA (YjgF/YER057c/UK114 family)/ketosteroid isomerase-like protein